MSEKNRNRRRSRNFVVDGRAQFRYAVPYILLLFVCAALMSVFYWIASTGLAHVGTSAVDLRPDALAELSTLQSELLNYFLSASCLLGLVGMILALIYSHRIFGPIIAIRKTIKALEAGQYDNYTQLRAHDEFKEVMADLARLQEQLKLRSMSGQ